MTIRAMTLHDLEKVLGWAAQEGWNPGLDDAAAFLAADPEGFLLKEVDGAPIAAISVVNHDPSFAFLGLYLCRPEYRGRGHGMAIWRAGMAHAGGRCVGLDGVPDQQANYARSGFVKTGSTVRFAGRLDRAPDPCARPIEPLDNAILAAWDTRACGMARSGFMTAWLTQTQTRQTRVLLDGDEIRGWATYRRCGAGCKIGPLHAICGEDALALMRANPFGAASDEVFIDTIGPDSPLANLLTAQGFEPVFETARMFTHSPPRREGSAFEAIATMELG